ncbi:MAG: hypothetical protein ACI88A_003440 [Paraglaciecola sp.]|jgi:hypothetical protein
MVKCNDREVLPLIIADLSVFCVVVNAANVYTNQMNLALLPRP